MDQTTQAVSMPLSYWEKLTRYVIEIDRIRKIVEEYTGGQ